MKLEKGKQPAGPAMTLGNMRDLGVQRLVAYCLNPSCRHEGLIDVSKFSDDTEVPSFARKVVCASAAAAAIRLMFARIGKEVPFAASDGE